MDVARNSAPAAATPNADRIKISRLVDLTSMPIEDAASSLSRIACAAIPTLPRNIQNTSHPKNAIIPNAAQ
jgi:hypothetical protein